MSLDQNLFTLNVSPNAKDPNIVDLVDGSGTVHYRKEKLSGTAYTVRLHDPTADTVLATATAPSAVSKHKTLQLHNPDAVIELKYTGTLSFKWTFKWEEHEFEWKREECYILRKPDPAVLVAVTKEPTGRLKTTTVQILDYNLNRFDIDDRKGLEIVILTALLTFHDMNEALHAPRSDDAPGNGIGTSTAALSGLLGIGLGNRKASSSSTNLNVAPEGDSPTPVLPPRPPPRTGSERISELHMMRTLQGEGEANEVEVGEEGSIEEFSRFAYGLLKDDAMLFITVRSASPAEVPKVLRVVEETKRLRHKSGEDELHQYVMYDTMARKGPRRIKLDDPRPQAYAPPQSLVIHLSKIDIPELKPRAEVKDPPSELGWTVKKNVGAIENGGATAGSSVGNQEKKGKGKDKDAREREKAQKRAEKEGRVAEKDHKHGSPPVIISRTHPDHNKFGQPALSGSPPQHRPNFRQPSPSPMAAQMHRQDGHSAPLTFSVPNSGPYHASPYPSPGRTSAPGAPGYPAGYVPPHSTPPRPPVNSRGRW
ncbi:uncharacterized protein FIBRA_00557 [Fibroporia radiculosa]|uniref:Uncharacterized protein n=1 Tax=Fibroporia radiculosa TaxID=599839 RepID=J4HRT1_9APHY|nr:uncharacterized protein FIBRA_00557 [Fibroporia radiculosa]CCL98557.1 predicted protein [Fibroporia radiculosa]